MSNILKIAGAGVSAAEETDENFNQTVLLLHGDGTNGAQNNTFLDSSTNNFTITRNGNTTQGTFSPFSAPDGRWSNYFDGTGDYLSLPQDTDFVLGLSDFTIECWFYPTLNNAADQFIYNMYGGASTAGNVSLDIRINGTTLSATLGSNGSADRTTTTVSSVVTYNAWNHVAFCREGSSTYLYVNGVNGGTQTGQNKDVTDTSYTNHIGANQVPSNLFNGYISNFRFVKGTCVYTGGTTFTPPTSPLTAITNTSLLTCQSNRFVDNSTNNFAITTNGDVKVTPFSPFAPTAAYSASVNGGSGYFDGTGDYLTTPRSTEITLGNNNFTLEFWLYYSSTAENIFYSSRTGNTYNGWFFGVNSSGYLFILASSNGTTWAINNAASNSGSVVPKNQWVHIALSRDGSSWKTFINGALNYTVTSSITIYEVDATVTIGADRLGSGSPVNGYLSGFRLLNGTAIDFASTGIPTAPPTNITNTSLLLNFTNAGIFDNTGKNNLETVADAQIDTTTKKYGTGSMEFDGTGDYLVLPDTLTGNFGTGDFTVEYWFRCGAQSTSYVTQVGTLDSGSASGSWRFGTQLAANDGVFFAYHNGTTFVDVTFTNTGYHDNNWHHAALTRSGSTVRAFIDGVQVGSNQTITQNFSARRVVVGAELYTPSYYTGFIDDLRITKGVARYTSNFTPPDAPFLDQ